MAQTELRDAFFAESRRDPFLHVVTHHVANAWAHGYEQALRDHGLDDVRVRETHADRFERAVEWLAEEGRRSRADALVALAALGKVFGRTSADGC